MTEHEILTAIIQRFGYLDKLHMFNQTHNVDQSKSSKMSTAVADNSILAVESSKKIDQTKFVAKTAYYPDGRDFKIESVVRKTIMISRS